MGSVSGKAKIDINKVLPSSDDPDIAEMKLNIVLMPNIPEEDARINNLLSSN